MRMRSRSTPGELPTGLKYLIVAKKICSQNGYWAPIYPLANLASDWGIINNFSTLAESEMKKGNIQEKL